MKSYREFRYVLAAVAFIVLAASVGCKSAPNPIETAQTPEQKAFAVYGEFVVYEEIAADIVRMPQVSDSVKQRLKEIDAKTKPAADALRDAAMNVIEARELLSAGQSTDAKLDTANANLEHWYLQTRDLVTQLQGAVRSK